MSKFFTFRNKFNFKDEFADAFSDIRVGHVCMVTYKPYGSRLRVKRFMGICILFTNKHTESRVVLRNLVGIFCVEFGFCYNSNRVVSFTFLREGQLNVKRSNLKYLKQKPTRLSTF